MGKRKSIEKTLPSEKPCATMNKLFVRDNEKYRQKF
jgi:hypothetical protein